MVRPAIVLVMLRQAEIRPGVLGREHELPIRIGHSVAFVAADAATAPAVAVLICEATAVSDEDEAAVVTETE